jgi:hypothetical protein
MHQQSDDFIDTPENVQRLILLLLLREDEERFWSLEGLVYYVGDAIMALDALTALGDAGLIHRRDRYVFPTRAAEHHFQLFGR